MRLKHGDRFTIRINNASYWQYNAGRNKMEAFNYGDPQTVIADDSPESFLKIASTCDYFVHVPVTALSLAQIRRWWFT